MVKKAIPEQFGKVIKRVAGKLPFRVSYTYGGKEEIGEKLKQGVGEVADSDKFTKLPLVALITDIQERGNGSSIDVNLEVYICANSQANYTAQERTRLTFEPILYPIFDSILEEICNGSEFLETVPELIDYDSEDKYTWGRANGSNQVYADKLDGIILKLNLKLEK